MALCTSCTTCSTNYIRCIAEFYNKNEKSIEFLRSHGALPTTVACPDCKKSCVYEKEQQLWVCKNSYLVPKSKKRRYCSYSVLDSKGSFIDNSSIPAWKVVLFVNHFISHIWEHENILLENLDLSKHTLSEWKSFCYEVTDEWFSNQEPIGGEGIEVEIHETLIVRRNKKDDIVENQIWLFGGIERDSKLRFVVTLTVPVGEKLDKQTLVPIIQKYIKPGSHIYSQACLAYNVLNDLGYTHFTTTDRSESSPTDADDESGNVDIKYIKQFWRDVNEWLKKKPAIRTKFLSQYLAKYMFVCSVPDKRHLLHEFFIQTAKLYPPFSDHQRPNANLHESDSETQETDLTTL